MSATSKEDFGKISRMACYRNALTPGSMICHSERVRVGASVPVPEEERGKPPKGEIAPPACAKCPVLAAALANS